MIVRHPWQPPVADELRDFFRAEGLTLVGVCDAEADPEAESTYSGWIERGYHGTMAWLARHADRKYRPSLVSEGTQSILFVGLNYFHRYPSGSAPAGRGRVARYAWGRDYHKELGNRLRRIARRLSERYPHERFRPYTDATPLAERHYAERASIGFTGRNTLLINGELGSWFVIGEILSSLRFNAAPAAAGRHGACPSRCVRCIDVCPTGALLGPFRIDATRCISYLTIEHDGPIDPGLRPLVGDWLFGCDLCQEVCPLNVRARETEVAGFLRPIAGSDVDLLEVLSIESDEAYRRRFAGSPLMRPGRRRMQRNACVVAGNTRDRRAVPRLRVLADSSDGMVAEHAGWALARIEANDQIAEGEQTE